MTPWKTTCMSVKCTGSHSGKASAWPGGYMSQGHKLLACNLKNVKNKIKEIKTFAPSQQTLLVRNCCGGF